MQKPDAAFSQPASVPEVTEKTPNGANASPANTAKNQKAIAPGGTEASRKNSSAADHRRAEQKSKKSAWQNAAPPLLVLCVILILAGSSFTGVTLQGNDNASSYLTVLIIELMAFGLPAAFFTKLQRPAFLKRLRLRLFLPGKIVFLLLSAVFLICSMTALKLLMYRVSGTVPAVQIISGITTPTLTRGALDGTYAVIAFAIVPAVLEEFLFRGVLFAAYEKRGIAPAVMLTALSCAMVHFAPQDFVVFLCGGIVLAMVLLLTDSLLGAMLVHLIYNLFVMGFENDVWAFANKPDGAVFFIFVSVSLLLLFGALLAGEGERILFARALSGDVPANGTVNQASPFKRTVQALAHPMLLVTILVYALLTFLL